MESAMRRSLCAQTYASQQVSTLRRLRCDDSIAASGKVDDDHRIEGLGAAGAI